MNGSLSSHLLGQIIIITSQQGDDEDITTCYYGLASPHQTSLSSIALQLSFAQFCLAQFSVLSHSILAYTMESGILFCSKQGDDEDITTCYYGLASPHQTSLSSIALQLSFAQFCLAQFSVLSHSILAYTMESGILFCSKQGDDEDITMCYYGLASPHQTSQNSIALQLSFAQFCLAQFSAPLSSFSLNPGLHYGIRYFVLF